MHFAKENAALFGLKSGDEITDRRRPLQYRRHRLSSKLIGHAPTVQIGPQANNELW